VSVTPGATSFTYNNGSDDFSASPYAGTSGIDFTVQPTAITAADIGSDTYAGKVTVNYDDKISSVLDVNTSPFVIVNGKRVSIRPACAIAIRATYLVTGVTEYGEYTISCPYPSQLPQSFDQAKWYVMNLNAGFTGFLEGVSTTPMMTWYGASSVPFLYNPNPGMTAYLYDMYATAIRDSDSEIAPYVGNGNAYYTWTGVYNLNTASVRCVVWSDNL
jgi:hypothetical protein